MTIADLKPYPVMKASGEPWLGEVPRHWELCRARYLFREVDLRTVTGAEAHLSMSQRLGLVPSSEMEERRLVSESYIGAKLCEPGDLVLNRLKAHLGVFALASQAGLVSPDYTVLRQASSGVSMRFFELLLKSSACRGELRTRAKGLVEGFWRLYTDDFYAIRLPTPPVPEQSSIVRFLDHAERRIRRHIRAKQKLINLLEEQKQAILHRAVTRGLDPKVRLRPSVKWLDDVPEHWNQLFLGRCLRRIDQGWSPVAAEGDISPEQWAVLTLSAVRRGVFNGTAIKPVPTTARIPEGIVISNGDLLLTRSNTRERVGDVCIVHDARERTVFSDLIYRLTTDPTIVNPRFLMYQLLSPFGRRQIERDARGSSGTMPKIAHRHIRSWRIVVPPLAEQDEIVDAIEHATRQISEAVKRTEVETELLREYRTRLIADVVTGKLDVREAAAPLPDEPEPLDDAAAPDADEANDAALDAALEESEA